MVKISIESFVETNSFIEISYAFKCTIVFSSVGRIDFEHSIPEPMFSCPNFTFFSVNYVKSFIPDVIMWLNLILIFWNISMSACYKDFCEDYRNTIYLFWFPPIQERSDSDDNILKADLNQKNYPLHLNRKIYTIGCQYHNLINLNVKKNLY